MEHAVAFLKMKKELKKDLFRLIVVIFVMPVYALATLGFFNSSLTFLHRASFQSRVRQGEFSELTVFSFSGDEYKDMEWTEEGREFRMDGKMYDISSVEKVDNNYIVSCKHDVMESFVANLFTFRKMNGMTKNLPKEKKVRKNLSFQHFSGQFRQEVQAKIIFRWIYFESFLIFPSNYYEVESPPPELIQLT